MIRIHFQEIKEKYKDYIVQGHTYKSCQTSDRVNYVLIMERVGVIDENEEKSLISSGNTIYPHDSNYPDQTLTNESRSNSVDPKHAKFRATKFKVLLIINKETGGTIDSINAVFTRYNNDCKTITTYTVGQFVLPDAFDCFANEVCTYGIHFFNEFDTAFFYDDYLPYDFTGTWTKHYDDGREERVVEFKNGKKNGLCKMISGDRCDQYNYEDDRRNGQAVEEDPRWKRSGNFDCDFKHGEWLCYDKSDKRTTKEYYVAGRLTHVVDSVDESRVKRAFTVFLFCALVSLFETVAGLN